MAWRSLDELSRNLVRLRLLEPRAVEEAMAQLPASQANPDAFLQHLERQGTLTPYQVSRLQKGETDGLVLGEFKLLYRNASGSFARVFRGCSTVDGRMVGLKVLRQRWAKDPLAIQQFHREAELCRKLRHKNIVPIYDVGSQDEYHWFTMEFVEGGNLRDFLAIRGKLSPLEATRCVLDMAEGLEYALRIGATHRDLKLTNVLMSSTGVAKLVDFGLAGLEGSGNDSGSGAGDGQQRALEYAAIEKCMGAPAGDPRSDLYFLGAIYYELLTGIPPYPRTNDRNERKNIARYRNIRPLRQVDPNIARAVTEIVERLMQIVPDVRYQTPTEVVADLRAALRELGDAARAVPSAAERAAAELPATARLLSGDADSELPPASTDDGNSGRPAGTLLFVEHRLKQQDVLRSYFSKHGFRVLMVANVERALSRLNTPNAPDCVILVGESLREDLPDAYAQAVARSGGTTPVIALLAEKQARLRDDLTAGPAAIVLVQPVTLRDLRKTIAELPSTRASESH